MWSYAEHSLPAAGTFWMVGNILGVAGAVCGPGMGAQGCLLPVGCNKGCGVDVRTWKSTREALGRNSHSSRPALR
jgi:hypothetical protein